MSAALRLSGVSFAYAGRPVLADVSLEVPRGRLIGLLGPNGSGKSTLMKLAAGLLRPSAGRVEIEGHDGGGLTRQQWARRVGVVPQDPLLPPLFTGGEIVMMGRTPWLGALAAERPVDHAAVARALELTGSTPLATRRVGELSGGERQRLVLARALAQEPAVLLLDEPTLHLDISHGLAILDVVLELVRRDGLAVLGVFHDLNLAIERCDELVVLSSGRVDAIGTPESVVTDDLVRRVFGVGATFVRHPDSGRPAVLPPPMRQGPPPASVQSDLVERRSSMEVFR